MGKGFPDTLSTTLADRAFPEDRLPAAIGEELEQGCTETNVTCAQRATWQNNEKNVGVSKISLTIFFMDTRWLQNILNCRVCSTHVDGLTEFDGFLLTGFDGFRASSLATGPLPLPRRENL